MTHLNEKIKKQNKVLCITLEVKYYKKKSVFIRKKKQIKDYHLHKHFRQNKQCTRRNPLHDVPIQKKKKIFAKCYFYLVGQTNT